MASLDEPFHSSISEHIGHAYLGKPSEGPSSANGCIGSMYCELAGCSLWFGGMAEIVSVRPSPRRKPGSNGDEYLEEMPLIAEGSMSMMDKG